MNKPPIPDDVRRALAELDFKARQADFTAPLSHANLEAIAAKYALERLRRQVARQYADRNILVFDIPLVSDHVSA